MTRECTTRLPAAALAFVVAMSLVVSAHAQRGSEHNASGCPDGTKDGVMAAQPTTTPGGGCDNTVYKTDEPPSTMRGINPKSQPDRAPNDATTSPKKKTKDKSE